ncbi:hypothetical protein BUALT_Bualt11G0070800 [Buddleja alternifolia]|uniref:RBR-type E3 ubiquitin transferase n=1 Tax=Buddleja alternifolia TaxID=168488 RepID=A0AAV6X3Z7_9LAMI|nr:hypothetical protein BUALT_Bualt11G0070800 [Buddleja alternifolia]
MATDVLEIVNIADNDDDDDEISIIYATPLSINKGTSKSDAISVEDYPIRAKTTVDLSKHTSYLFDDEVILLDSFPKILSRVCKGESSNTKPAKATELIIPLTFMCEICADEKPRTDMFRILGCNHIYCSDCMSKYVASKIQENITIINCPVSGCKGFLEPQHCRSILPKQVFDRWGDALCEAVILASEKFYCPFKDCSAMLIDEQSGGNEVMMESVCPECNRLFCVQCKVPWHSGISCVEFQKLKKDERSHEDILLMNLAKSKNWIRCPKCKFYVEKSQGCLFMRCRYGYIATSFDERIIHLRSTYNSY